MFRNTITRNGQTACGARRNRSAVRWDDTACPCRMEVLEERSLLSGLPGFSLVDVGFEGRPNAVAVADFNRDGFLDVATALTNTQVGVALGNGDGTFQSPQYIEIPVTGPTTTAGVVAGDLNEDGRPDLVVVQYGAGDAINAMLNTSQKGILSFNVMPRYIMGSFVGAAALGDINQDGHLDVMTTSIGGDGLSSLSYRLGEGDGTFGFHFLTPFWEAAGRSPTDLALGDMNGDGRLDVALTYGANAGLSANKVGILLNKGPGILRPVDFSLPRFYDVGSGSSSLTLGDFNRDGALDVAATLPDKNSVAVLLNDGKGGLKRKGGGMYPTGKAPGSVVTADFNRDGKLDLAVSNVDGQSVSILLGNGNGTFRPGHTPPAVFALNGIPNYRMGVGDFNDDGMVDLAVPVIYDDAHGAVSVLLNMGRSRGNR